MLDFVFVICPSCFFFPFYLRRCNLSTRWGLQVFFWRGCIHFIDWMFFRVSIFLRNIYRIVSVHTFFWGFSICDLCRAWWEPCLHCNWGGVFLLFLKSSMLLLGFPLFFFFLDFRASRVFENFFCKMNLFMTHFAFKRESFIIYFLNVWPLV